MSIIHVWLQRCFSERELDKPDTDRLFTGNLLWLELCDTPSAGPTRIHFLLAKGFQLRIRKRKKEIPKADNIRDKVRLWLFPVASRSQIRSPQMSTATATMWHIKWTVRWSTTQHGWNLQLQQQIAWASHLNYHWLKNYLIREPLCFVSRNKGLKLLKDSHYGVGHFIHFIFIILLYHTLSQWPILLKCACASPLSFSISMLQ